MLYRWGLQACGYLCSYSLPRISLLSLCKPKKIFLKNAFGCTVNQTKGKRTLPFDRCSAHLRIFPWSRTSLLSSYYSLFVLHLHPMGTYLHLHSHSSFIFITLPLSITVFHMRKARWENNSVKNSLSHRICKTIPFKKLWSHKVSLDLFHNTEEKLNSLFK